jgi:hypothetical protein
MIKYAYTRNSRRFQHDPKTVSDCESILNEVTILETVLSLIIFYEVPFRVLRIGKYWQRVYANLNSTVIFLL